MQFAVRGVDRNGAFRVIVVTAPNKQTALASARKHLATVRSIEVRPGDPVGGATPPTVEPVSRGVEQAPRAEGLSRSAAPPADVGAAWEAKPKPEREKCEDIAGGFLFLVVVGSLAWGVVAGLLVSYLLIFPFASPPHEPDAPLEGAVPLQNDLPTGVSCVAVTPGPARIVEVHFQSVPAAERKWEPISFSATLDGEQVDARPRGARAWGQKLRKFNSGATPKLAVPLSLPYTRLGQALVLEATMTVRYPHRTGKVTFENRETRLPARKVWVHVVNTEDLRKCEKHVKWREASAGKSVLRRTLPSSTVFAVWAGIGVAVLIPALGLYLHPRSRQRVLDSFRYEEWSRARRFGRAAKAADGPLEVVVSHLAPGCGIAFAVGAVGALATRVLIYLQ